MVITNWLFFPRLQATKQPSDFQPENAVTEVTPTADIRPMTEVTPATTVTPQMSVNTAQSVHRIFSPPSFLCKKPDSAAASRDHSSQQKSAIPPTSVCSKSISTTADKDTAWLDKEGFGDLEPRHSACENDTDGKECLSLSDSADQKSVLSCHTPDAKNNRTDGGARSPLKPCNVTKKFQSPVASQLQHGSEHNQSSVENRNSSTAGNHVRTPVIQSGCGRHVAVEPDSAVKCSYISVVWCKLSKKKVQCEI